MEVNSLLKDMMPSKSTNTMLLAFIRVQNRNAEWSYVIVNKIMNHSENMSIELSWINKNVHFTNPLVYNFWSHSDFGLPRTLKVPIFFISRCFLYIMSSSSIMTLASRQWDFSKNCCGSYIACVLTSTDICLSSPVSTRVSS